MGLWWNWADTAVLGTVASAWEFESLQTHFLCKLSCCNKYACVVQVAECGPSKSEVWGFDYLHTLSYSERKIWKWFNSSLWKARFKRNWWVKVSLKILRKCLGMADEPSDLENRRLSKRRLAGLIPVTSAISFVSILLRVRIESSHSQLKGVIFLEFILGFFIGFVLASLCFLLYISIKIKSENDKKNLG